MLHAKQACLLVVGALILTAPSAFPDNGRTLVGWGLEEKDPEAFIAAAAEVGFDVLISGSTNPDFLQRAVEIAKRHDIGVYSFISPMGRLGALWRKAYPERAIPWQVMTPEEDAAYTFLSAGTNRYLAPFQFGGEPALTHEVLLNQIICPTSIEARVLLESTIDTIASVPGIEGLALDGFGYQNYRRCHCERCKALFAEFAAKNPEVPKAEAEVTFFRDVLVSYINHLADYARARKADIRTTIHLWPVFLPEPLYGNRLDVDFCGQTAAWYMLWPEEKIADYSRRIVSEANAYYPRQEGVGMIGYYDLPGKFPVKDAARVDLELSTMIANGCRRIQVCSTGHVIRNEAVAAVFRRYFK